MPDVISCYAKYFDANRTGDPSMQCGSVEIPRFIQNYDVDGLKENLGVPRCIAKSYNFNFAPRNRYSFGLCQKEINNFLGVGALTKSLAQMQYEDHLDNLRWLIERRRDEVTRKFNCVAQRQSICL